jgi:hypothetical protein
MSPRLASTAGAALLLSGCALLGIGGTATASFNITVDMTRAAYIEGALTFVAIDDGEAFQVEGGESHEIPSGPHVLHSYVRPCNGMCNMLDAPRDACEIEIDSLPGDVITVSIVRAAGEPCTITVASGAPPASA